MASSGKWLLLSIISIFCKNQENHFGARILFAKYNVSRKTIAAREL